MRRLALVAALALAAPAAADDADALAFKQRVNKAIDRGVAFLRAEQRKDGRWLWGREKEFPYGMTAWCLFALATSGVAHDQREMAAGFGVIQGESFEQTYVAAAALLAVEAAYAEPPARWYRKNTRMPEPIRALALRCTRELVGGYKSRQGGWSYPLAGGGTASEPADRMDHSHVQLVLLALKAACRLGLGRAVPESRWFTCLRQQLRYPESRGPRVAGPLAIRYARRGGKWIRVPFGARGAEARGWDYDPKEQQDPVYGSMTAAGIGSVLICQSELIRRRSGRYKPLAGKCGSAVEGGLAWLKANWKVDANPGARDWHYYYLYALERVGMFLSLEKIGGRDWYREGALHLLDKQEKDGSWSQSDVEKTCYALLFLKRASVPVMTGQ